MVRAERMSHNTSLTSIIAELGFLKEPELGEVQARQLIYGGDQELNLLELGAVTEEQLVTALEKFTGLTAASHGFLPVDLGLSTRAAEVTDLVVAGVDENQSPIVYSSGPLEAETRQLLQNSLGSNLAFRAAPRLRIAEAKAAMGLFKLTVRETSLLERLGARPIEASIHTAAPPEGGEQAIDAPPPKAQDTSHAAALSAREEIDETPPASLPEALPVTEEPPQGGDSFTSMAPLPPGDDGNDEDITVLMPAKPRHSSLMGNQAPTVVETGPPPQGYEELTASSQQRNAEAKAGRAGPRLRYSTTEAIADLSGAKSRDRVIDVLVHYAAQFFEYTAVFAVLSAVARGLRATGSGTGSEDLKKLKIPLDLPSAFHNAQNSTAPQVTRLKASGLEGGIAQDLNRPTGREILLLPIGVRGRSVLILWGDRGKEGVNYQSVSELLSFAPAVSQALERVLIEHMRASRVANPPGTLHTPLVPPKGTPTPVPAPLAEGVPQASAPTTRRNPAAPAAQAPNMGTAHEVAPAQKRTFGGQRSPSEHPEASPSEPPMNFPVENPKTIRGFPRINSPKEIIKGFEVREEAPLPRKPSLQPPLTSRRIVPLDSVVRIQSDPPMAPAEPVEVPNIAPAPPPFDRESFGGNDVPELSARGTLMSRRPPVYEPSADDWGSDGSSPEVQVPPLGRITAARGKSGGDLVRRLLKGDETVIDRLVESGETAVGALIAEFPGPVREPKDATVPASECGPILKALVAIGSKATPFLTVRTADEDANVRRWATFVLGELPGKDAAKAIAERLLDDSTDVRRAALASARRARKDVLTRRTLRTQMEEMCREVGLGPESRAAAIEALADIREHEATPTLLQLLDDGDSSVVRSARWALSVLTRQDFGTDNDSWRRFWRENRDVDRVEWLISSLDHEQRDLRRAAGEELKGLSGKDFGFNEDLGEPERRIAQAEFRRWWKNEGKASDRSAG